MLRKNLIATSLLLLLGMVYVSVVAAQPEETPPPPDLIVLAGKLIDGTGAPPQENLALIIRQGRIDEIVPLSKQPQGTDAPVINATDATVLPGFINAYTHVLEEALSFGGAWTRQGVTTVADMATPLGVMYPFRWYFNQRVSPHLVMAGPTITAPNGYPTLLLGPDFAFPVSGVENAKSQVQQLINEFQVDVIHIAVTSIVPEWPQLSVAEIKAVVDTAHAQGRKVLAYVDKPEDIATALDGNVDGLAHMPFHPVSDALLQRIVDAGVVFVPILGLTYEALDDAGDKAALLENARRLHELGGKLALGDRAGIGEIRPGLPATEMKLLREEVGLTPMEVVLAATKNAAEALGVDRMTGSLQPGMLADMVIVAGNPLSEVTALSNVVAVVKGGIVAYSVAKGNRRAPLVKITNPGAGTPVIKGELPIALQVELGGEATLGSLSIDLDHELLYYEATVPNDGAVQVDTTRLSDGWHIIGATAVDEHNNVTRSTASFRTDNWKIQCDKIDAPVENSWFGTIDLSQTSSTSDGWAYASEPEASMFDDEGRRIRTTDTDEYLVWETPHLYSFSVQVIVSPDVAAQLPGLVRVEVSADEEAWYEVPFTVSALQESETGWKQVELQGQVRDVEANWCRITFLGGNEAAQNGLQLGQVDFVMRNPL